MTETAICRNCGYPSHEHDEDVCALYDAGARREYECNSCAASTRDDASLVLSRGKACPFCGEGVVLQVRSADG